MAFTRKHYLKIGETQSEIESYVRMFKVDNPRFDAQRFRDYVAGKIKR